VRHQETSRCGSISAEWIRGPRPRRNGPAASSSWEGHDELPLRTPNSLPRPGRTRSCRTGSAIRPHARRRLLGMHAHGEWYTRDWIALEPSCGHSAVAMHGARGLARNGALGGCDRTGSGLPLTLGLHDKNRPPRDERPTPRFPVARSRPQAHRASQASVIVIPARCQNPDPGRTTDDPRQASETAPTAMEAAPSQRFRFARVRAAEGAVTARTR